MKLSAVLIVRDEEDRLSETLEALRRAVDEIVVVDTGSMDDTIACAQAYTATVFHFSWQNDFSAARNFALDKANGDYALTIDADEKLLDADAAGNALREFARTHPSTTVGTVRILNVLGGPEEKIVVDDTERFFHRATFRYQGAIHEQLSGPEAKRRAPTGVELLHTGYNAEDAARQAAKSQRNLALLHEEIQRHPGDEYFLYQLGKSYFSAGRHSAAARHLEAALAAIDFRAPAAPAGAGGVVSRKVLTDAIVTLAYAYANRRAWRRAEALLEKHAALGHPGVQRADFPHARGYIFLMQGKWEEAEAAYTEALGWGAAEDVQGAGTYSCHYQLGLAAEGRRAPAEAMARYGDALQANSAYGPALRRAVGLGAETGLPLPEIFAAHADAPACRAAYIDQLTQCLENGAMPAVERLVRQAAALSPELLEACRSALAAYQAKSGSCSKQ